MPRRCRKPTHAVQRPGVDADGDGQKRGRGDVETDRSAAAVEDEAIGVVTRDPHGAAAERLPPQEPCREPVRQESRTPSQVRLRPDGQPVGVLLVKIDDPRPEDPQPLAVGQADARAPVIELPTHR